MEAIKGEVLIRKLVLVEDRDVLGKDLTAKEDVPGGEEDDACNKRVCRAW